MNEIDEWEDACSLLDSLTSLKSNPMLINFGGMTYYACGVPIESIEIPPETEFTDEMDVLERDLRVIIHIDKYKTRQLFSFWKAKSKVKREKHLQALFNKWQKHYVFKSHKSVRDNKYKLIIMRVWLQVVHARMLTQAGRKIKLRFIFKQWKTSTQNILLSKRLVKSSAKFKFRSYFRKWRNKANRNILLGKHNDIIKKKKDRVANNCFSKWCEKYLYRAKKLRTGFHIQKRIFQQWIQRYEISVRVGTRAQSIMLQRQRKITLVMFILWRRRAKTHRKKRERENIQKWAKVSCNLLSYFRVKLAIARIRQRYVLSRMKGSLVAKDRRLVKAYISSWRKYIFVMRKKKACSESHARYVLYRALISWYLQWRAVSDERLCQIVRSHVVEPHIRSRFFTRWIDLATYYIKERKIRAIRLRKILIKRRFFSRWMSFCEMRSLCAEQHYNKNILLGSFTLFVKGTIVSKRENEQKAIDFRTRHLKRKYFRRFKLLIPVPTYALDTNLSNLISTLNGDAVGLKFTMFN